MNSLKRIIADMELAIKYGVSEAIVLEQIIYWVTANAANGNNFNEGRTWVYNSRKAWCELLPCFTEKQIRRILDSLLDQGVIVKNNFNKVSFDQTSWYALSDEVSFFVKSNGPNGPMTVDQTGQSEVPKRANQYQDSTKIDNQDNKAPSYSPLKEKNGKYLPIAQYLRDKIKASGTEAVFKESHLSEWCGHFRLMVEQDHRTEEHIRAKIDAVFEDSFWCKQIRSAKTLREKWKLGRLDRLQGKDQDESDEEDVEIKEQPQTPFERFISKSSQLPAEQVYLWFIGIWERVYGNKNWAVLDLPDSNSAKNDYYKRLWYSVYTAKQAGCDDKAAIEKAVQEFNLNKGPGDDEY